MGTGDLAWAVWFGEPGRVEIRGEEIPEAGPEDLRVRTVISAISHGTELKVFQGEIDPGLPLDLPTLRGSYGFPIKYGYASVGRVVQAGEAVERFSPGDLVFALHPHQTEYILPARLAIRLPEGIDPEVAGFMANLETAVNVLLDAHPRLGERVVVLGQGVIGLLITQLLRRAGASLIVAIDPLERRRALARALGADVVLDPSDQLEEAIRDFTGGTGADLAIEASGHPGALRQAIELVAFQGTIVVCSWYGTGMVPLDLGGAFHRRRLRLVSSQVSAIDPALQPRWDRSRRQGLVLDLLPRLLLPSLITHRIPFDRAAEAYRLIAQQPSDTLQVLLTYAGEKGGDSGAQ